MSVPLGNVNGRNLVIASVGTSTEASINYQESNDLPSERPNGGDLLPGDLWYDDSTDTLYIFTTMGWAPVGVGASGGDLFVGNINLLETGQISISGSDFIVDPSGSVVLKKAVSTSETVSGDTQTTLTTKGYVDELRDTIDLLRSQIEGLQLQLQISQDKILQLEQADMAMGYTVDNLSIKIGALESDIQNHEQRLMDGGL